MHATGRDLASGEVVTIEVDRIVTDAPLTHGRYFLDQAQRTFTVDGHPVPLTYMEIQVMRVLMLHAPNITPRQDIRRHAYCPDRSIPVYISILRKKLRNWDAIRTYHGLGYQLL